MEAMDVLKIFGGVAFGALLARISRASDSAHDMSVRIAVLTERVEKMEKGVNRLEESEKAQWRMIDTRKRGDHDRS
jgi:hypothetical protein